VTADNAKVEIERRMSELVDLLAIFLDADIDPRAWRQLLTYAPMPTKETVTERLREALHLVVLQAVEEEREACARVAETGADYALPQMAELQRSIARCIRSRVER
jgi:hypothetical protein